MAYDKVSPPNVHTTQESLDEWKRLFSISTRFMATKLDKVVAYYIGPPRTHNQWKKLYLQWGGCQYLVDVKLALFWLLEFDFEQKN